MPSKGIRAERDGATPFAFQEITVTSSAGGLTLPRDVIVVGALIEVIGNNALRLRFDGGDPTTTVGHLMNPGAADYLNAQELRQLRHIATASDATLLVTLYRG